MAKREGNLIVNTHDAVKCDLVEKLKTYTLKVDGEELTVFETVDDNLTTFF